MLETVEHDLRQALTHLYDPGYQPAEVLYALLGAAPCDGALGIQTAVAQLIEGQEPPPDAPVAAKTRRVYDLLHNRFLLKLTQEETAERLHMSLSSVQRGQREAVRVLARVLAERGQAACPGEGQSQGRGEEPAPVPVLDLRTQFQREVDSLEASTPDRLCDVGEVVSGLLELLGALSTSFGVRVDVVRVEPGLAASVHPIVLRQVLLASIRQLAPHAADGRVTIFAGHGDGNVRITLRCHIAGDSGVTAEQLINGIPVPERASVVAGIEGTQAYVSASVPLPGAVTVLVVDDNPDMVRLYQRFTEGTKYRILSSGYGRNLYETIEASAPGIVVLDVMLPDVDGWHLLMRLHENPATRTIPVIVCSVIRQEALAISLGAKAYLAKPVRPSEFIRALDRVLPQVSEEAPRSPE